MVRLSGINLYMKKMEMEDEGFIPIGLDTGTDMGDFEDEKDSKIFIRVTFCIKNHKITISILQLFVKLL